MTGPRSYADPCGIARALDVIGERWALLIVRELAFGPKRFTDLRAALGASPNVVSQRLGELEQASVVQRTGGSLYELTDWGRELHPILLQLGRWGARANHRPGGDLSSAALLLALEATFAPERAVGLSATYDLRLDGERFSVQVDAGNIVVARGSPRQADAVIAADSATLRAVVFGDRELTDAGVEMSGDGRLARRFFRLFVRP